MAQVYPHVAPVQRGFRAVRHSSLRPDQLPEPPGASTLLTAGLSAERAAVGGELLGTRGVEGEPRRGEGAQPPGPAGGTVRDDAAVPATRRCEVRL